MHTNMNADANANGDKSRFLKELKRLVEESGTGNFDVVLSGDNLSRDDTEIVQLINKIVGNYRAAVEYDIMKYKLSNDALDVGLWDMNVVRGDPIHPENSFTWSQEIRYMLGFSDEGDFPNILRSWSDRLHPEDKKRTLDSFLAHISDTTGRTPYDLEYRLMLKNGEYRYFRALGNTLRNSEGIPLRVAGALMDITEIKQTREALNKALSESNKTRDIVTNILNNSNVMIYVTDLETNEILFISDYMKQHFNINENVVGQPCYKIFNVGVNKRCDWCPCHQLDNDPDKVVIWEERNTLTNNYYRNIDRYIDWPGGKKVHIQYSTDLSDFKQTQDSLERNQKMTEALNKAAILFLSQHIESFEDMMTTGVEYITSVLDVNRVSVWRNHEENDGLHVSMIYRWDKAAGGTTLPTETFIDVMYSQYAPSWEGIFAERMSVNGPVRLMPEREAATLKSFGVVSAFVAPLFINQVFWGFMLFEDRYNERYFDNESAEMMRSAAFLCANTIMRTEMEREIVRANERTRILLDKTPICCQLWDSTLSKIDCNEAAVKLFGFKDKQEYMERYYELYPEYQPDGELSTEKSKRYAKKAFEEGGSVFNWTYRMLDGTIMPAEVIFIRVEYENDFILTGYTRDLREHNKMMQEIEYRDNLLYAVNRAAVMLLNSDVDSFESALYQSMKTVTEAVKADRTYVWKNHIIDGQLAMTQLHEVSETYPPLQGSDTVVDVIYSDISDEWEKTLKNGNCINKLVRDMSPKEQAHLSPQDILSILIVPIFIKDQFWGIVGFDDCTQERIFTEEEETILRSASLLIANSLLRNEMVLNIRDTSVQLEAAFEQANAASKAKGEFLATMSHEMRTPMNAIIGMTAIGRKTDVIEEKNHALNKIEDASSHLLGVINDVLDMAKIEANKLEIMPVEYNFEKMLQKVITVSSYRIDERQQVFTVNVDDNIPQFIVGDDQRLAQVITNLLSNANKFTPEGGTINLSVSLTDENNGNCELRIEVADNGIGISSEQQKRLFKAFEQAESGTSRKYGGTGLGLVLSKRIVELMEGKIWVESELGKGARFIFTVKVRRGHKSPRSLLANGVNWENVRILVVDDMVETLSYFTSIFENLNIHIDTATSGAEAWDIIKKNGEYDIYFIDWNMPGMNGIDLTTQIRSLRGNRPSVVIMITAANWEFIRNDAMTAGVNSYLLKPLFSSMVIDCLNTYIGTAFNKGSDTKNIDGTFEGKRLLIAEDVEINREIIIALLEDTGLVIDCAENGKEAVEMVEAEPYKYNMIFMDVQMPVMDGLEATQRIRALPGVQNMRLPIIAMTANVFKDDIEACLSAGMDDHIGKPLDIDKIMEILHKYLVK